MKNSTLYSIGHGNKTIEQFIEELKFFDIAYLIDVRSKPYSRHSPQFNKEILKQKLEENNIKYYYLGHLLGGLPDDPTCYTNGHIDYSKVKEKNFFKRGLQKLIEANKKKIKLAIMCSETRPEQCHRSKLIGRELKSYGIELNHIVRNKRGDIIIKTQNEVMSYITPNGDVPDLFGSNISFLSRNKYKSE